jgi:hypothetical protein
MKQIPKLLFLLLLAFNHTGFAQQADSSNQINKSWDKVAFQMRKFNDATKAYVKTLKKAKPADSNITKDVESKSDSVDHYLSFNGIKDSLSLKKLNAQFDSLVQSSVRLVKKVENDTSLRNNKTLKKLGNSLTSMRSKMSGLNAKNKSKARKEESDDTPKPE